MIRSIYSAVMRVAPVLALPGFLLSRRGRARLLERFGAWGALPERFLWLHGASVGEINGLIPLVTRLRERYPDEDILLSAASVTGLEQAATRLGAHAWLHLRLLPFDHAHWISKALRGSVPRGFIISETELWPGVISFCRNAGVPIGLINGRVSSRSAQRYLLLGALLRECLDALRVVCVQSEELQDRFKALGVPSSRLTVSGNTKYDFAGAQLDDTQRRTLHRRLFADERPVVVLGSLRVGEDQEWFPEIASKIRQSRNRLGFVIAPRHEEKFEYFARSLAQHGIPFRRWSDGAKVAGTGEADSAAVILLDAMGELARVYSVATVSFIGGTLRNFGGHNPLEPAPYGSAICLGGYYQNAADAVALLKDYGGVIELKGKSDIEQVLRAAEDKEVSVNGRPLTEVGRCAFEAWQSQRGSVSRTLTALELGGVVSAG